ncbi:hypothetical protein KEJ19_04360 [Candidatus Bathyarchaeota archaeon]|nr:hypothetical protein [Candidatus Bathyarchaeota archaeon]
MKLWKAVARKLKVRGSPYVWGASIYYTYCRMVFRNGVSTKSVESLFGVSEAAFTKKCTEIRKLLKLNYYDKRFTPPRVYAESPMAEIEEMLMESKLKGIEGFFEVKEKRAEGVLLVNLEDGKEYFVRERKALEKLEIGHVVSATIFPKDDYYVFPGIIRILDPKDKEQRAFIKSIKDYYSGKYIEKAIEIQRDFCEASKEYFGSTDPVFKNGKEAEEAFEKFIKWFSRERKVPGKGKTPLQLSEEKGRKKVPEIPRVRFPREILDAKDVGIVFDEVGGIRILPEYGKVKELFQGDFRKVPNYKDLLEALVYEEGFIPSFVLRSLIEKNPERAVEVFATRFRNIKSIQNVLSLLKRNRSDWDEKPKPTIIPVGR